MPHDLISITPTTIAVASLTVHPAADLFPMLSEPELRAMADDIAAHGLREPLIVQRGVLLDGRNRRAACALAGFIPHTTEFEGDEEAVLHLITSLNQHRRHLLPGQKAAIAADLEPMFASAAEQRLLSGTLAPAGARVGKAAAHAAEAAGSSRNSTERAKTVKRDAVPEVFEALREGRLPVRTAVALAKLPPEAQRAVVAAPGDIRTAHVRQASKRVRNESLGHAAEAAAPAVEGIDLRLCGAAELLEDETLQGAVQLVHADPPWSYRMDGAGNPNDIPYAAIGLPDIVEHIDRAFDCALPDARLLVWCTGPLLAEWMKANTQTRWAYVGCGAWHKTGRPGVGHHWRGDAELLLMYTKGAPPKPSGILSSGHGSARGEHSEKPVEWLERMVEEWTSPDALVLDLYAGRAPLARACKRFARRYVGCEIDPARHALALGAM